MAVRAWAGVEWRPAGPSPAASSTPPSPCAASRQRGRSGTRGLARPHAPRAPAAWHGGARTRPLACGCTSTRPAACPLSASHARIRNRKNDAATCTTTTPFFTRRHPRSCPIFCCCCCAPTGGRTGAAGVRIPSGGMRHARHSGAGAAEVPGSNSATGTNRLARSVPRIAATPSQDTGGGAPPAGWRHVAQRPYTLHRHCAWAKRARLGKRAAPDAWRQGGRDMSQQAAPRPVRVPPVARAPACARFRARSQARERAGGQGWWGSRRSGESAPSPRGRRRPPRRGVLSGAQLWPDPPSHPSRGSVDDTKRRRQQRLRESERCNAWLTRLSGIRDAKQ